MRHQDTIDSYEFTTPAGTSYALALVKANDPDPLNGVDVQDVASIRWNIL